MIPGCYITGDVAVNDKDGYIAVLGRADDVLNVAGHRIGTAEVESALVSHPAVAEAAAIGIPDALKGEAIKAFVQLRAGHTAVGRSGCRARSSTCGANSVRSRRPRRSSLLPRLPKTRSGKIMRRLLEGTGNRRRDWRSLHPGAVGDR